MITSLHTRLTRTSSDLRTLVAPLSPPSPILTADDVLVSCSSGEIPILLDSFLLVNCVKKVEVTFPEADERIESLVAQSALPCDPASRNQRNGPPARVPLENTTSPLDLAKSCDPEQTHGSPLSLRGDPSEHLWESSPIATYDIGSPSDLRSTSKKHMVGAEKLQDVPSFPADTELDHFVISSFHTYSTLLTPCFALPSPTSSMDLNSPISPSPGQRYRRPLERARAVRFQGRPRSPRRQLYEADTEGGYPTSPVLAASSIFSCAWHPSNTSSLSWSCSSDSLGESDWSAATYTSQKFGILPKDLSWLKDAIIELWIDQEGFRAVKLSMHLMGYSPRSRSLQPYGTIDDGRSDLTAGIVEFMPVKREVFAFHYATLDGPPTLRMISLGGDESRDFISRQASLSVKSNGVYTVLGAETFPLSILDGEDHEHGIRSEHVKLRWKFDYLVGDRRVDASGKTLAGEKALTPLTFSCSPYLFHPFQGKKIGLMHIVKKNFVPKLSSEKLEPPPLPTQVQRQPSHEPPAEFPRRPSSTHGRSLSDAHAKVRLRDEPGMRYAAPSSPLGVGGRHRAIQGASRIQYTRRRRASSAGENSLPISEEHVSGRSGNALLLPSPDIASLVELSTTDRT